MSEAADQLDELRGHVQLDDWPEPTTAEPGRGALEEWLWDGSAEAKDGCVVEVDGLLSTWSSELAVEVGIDLNHGDGKSSLDVEDIRRP